MILLNIADHLVSVDNRNTYPVAPLLASCKPFIIGKFHTPDSSHTSQEGVATPVVDIILDDSASIDYGNDMVGRFYSGDNCNVVYALSDGGYVIELCGAEEQVCAILQSDSAFRHITISLRCRQKEKMIYSLRNAMMMSYAFATASHDTLLIHSSVIVNRERAFLFLGKSGTGKSTHTRLWRENIPCSAILNDDNPVLRVINGKTVVYGSPWSGKTPCYRNLSANVKGITMLSQAPYNSMRQLSVIEGFADMMASVSNMKWDRRVNNGIISTIGHILEHTPLYHLDCLPNSDAAHLSFATQS